MINTLFEMFLALSAYTRVFEKQNIIITEWETEKAKSRSDNIYERRKRKRIKKRNRKMTTSLISRGTSISIFSVRAAAVEAAGRARTGLR